jgi:hypothetical protein
MEIMGVQSFQFPTVSFLPALGAPIFLPSLKEKLVAIKRNISCILSNWLARSSSINLDDAQYIQMTCHLL